MEELVRATTQNWKEVMTLYLGLMEALKGFQETAPDISPDMFGPELQEVFAMGLHRQKPVYVIEHLEWSLTQKGDLSHLIPREPEPEEPVESVEEPDEEQIEPSKEPPLEPEGGTKKGKQSGSPEKESTARKTGELKEELG